MALASMEGTYFGAGRLQTAACTKRLRPPFWPTLLPVPAAFSKFWMTRTPRTWFLHLALARQQLAI
ncbi:hypothetical protein PG996_009847 [Apiospora saccharicola]|uniref:Uncharacterized protein n=1 Tax=Apiospora saccharicola TaxID=335842 RepID=A0ABR1UML3_9PEZI